MPAYTIDDTAPRDERYCHALPCLPGKWQHGIAGQPNWASHAPIGKKINLLNKDKCNFCTKILDQKNICKSTNAITGTNLSKFQNIILEKKNQNVETAQESVTRCRRQYKNHRAAAKSPCYLPSDRRGDGGSTHLFLTYVPQCTKTSN
jgi:hypothetical protein